MASAVLVTHEDYHLSVLGSRGLMSKSQKSKRAPVSDVGRSSNMPGFDDARERNSVSAEVGGGKGNATPIFEATSDDSSSLNRKSISLNVDTRKDDWRSYPVNKSLEPNLNVGGSSVVPVSKMTKEERRSWRRKLKLELEQVRVLSSKLEAREYQLKEQSHSAGLIPSYSDFQISGNMVRSCVGKEVTSELDSTPVGPSASFPKGLGFLQQTSLPLMDVSPAGAEHSLKEKRTPKANQLYNNSEFVVGKEKMPPSEKPKSKTSAGSKRTILSRIGSRESKRQPVDMVQSKQVSKLMRQCRNLLKKLMGHKHGWIFNEPVDAAKLGLSDYHLIIKRPMDFGTVQTKFKRKDYVSPTEFAEDVRLTFFNAMTYNPPGHDVHEMADELKKIFEDSWKPIEAKYDAERLKLEEVNMNNHKKARQPLQQAPQKYLSEENSVQSQAKAKKASLSKKAVAVKPKPKSKPERDMTFQEKKKLSSNLQLLPPDKLEYIVQLMKERNPNLSQKDDEIEVDIDTFDKDLLWELNRYVMYCIKSIGKNKKKADQNQSLKNQSMVGGGGNLNNIRKGDAGDEDVEIDDDIPNASFPPVVIDKDGGYASKSSSSGSSSSVSGSSSDSGSSSGSDSDADHAQSAGIQ